VATVLGMTTDASAGHGEKEWRLETANGPVYVLRPPRYDAETAGIVVYVHGLFNDVDSAWDEHNLRDQFIEANRNAIFIVPEAPVAAEDAVRWPKLAELLDTVRKKLPKVLPEDAPVFAVGHSGAYRTIACWLDYPGLQHIVLVDGLYGNEEEYAAWVNAPSDVPHRFAMTVTTTWKWATPFLERFPDAVILPRIPDWVFPDRAKEARVVSMPSQYEHMELIEDGKALPVMLRILPLKRRIEWNKKAVASGK
jgi:hypothetical protein